MNRILIITAISIVVIAAIAAFIWLPRGAIVPTNTQTYLPNNGGSNSTVVIQQNQNPQAARAAYQASLTNDNVDNIRPQQTAVSDGYALQLWAGDHTGGEALMKFDIKKNSWVIVDPGGGAWSVEGLVAFGVPTSTAEALLQQVPH